MISLLIISIICLLARLGDCDGDILRMVGCGEDGGVEGILRSDGLRDVFVLVFSFVNWYFLGDDLLIVGGFCYGLVHGVLAGHGVGAVLGLVLYLSLVLKFSLCAVLSLVVGLLVILIDIRSINKIITSMTLKFYE